MLAMSLIINSLSRIVVKVDCKLSSVTQDNKSNSRLLCYSIENKKKEFCSLSCFFSKKIGFGFLFFEEA